MNTSLEVGKTALRWGAETLDAVQTYGLPGHGLEFTWLGDTVVVVDREDFENDGVPTLCYSVKLCSPFFSEDAGTYHFRTWPNAMAFAVGAITIKRLAHRLRTINVEKI